MSHRAGAASPLPACTVNRRRLLGAAVAGTATLAGAQARPGAARGQAPTRVDVVVVGAGFAGLSAAR